MIEKSCVLRCIVILLFVSRIYNSFAEGSPDCEEQIQVSGIRLEAINPNYQKSIGYMEKGVSTVQAGVEVRVVVFGRSLAKVKAIGFSSKLDCSQVFTNENTPQFIIQKDDMIALNHIFPESEGGTEWSICVAHYCNGQSQFELVRDSRTKISTDIPKRSYYLVWLPIQIGVIVVLIIFSGLFSGLNLGLMSLTPQELTLISRSGSKQERFYAETILPVRKKGNLLLCSLLIGNVIVNSGISILFDDLTSGPIALILSSFGIVVFGEIFPQALCVKKGLAVGAYTINITRFFMVLTWPLAFPISLVLNCILGGPVASYDRKRIMELIKLSTRNDEGLAEELKIAVGAMEISDKTVADVITKAEDVYMLADDTVLNTTKIAEILRTGYTRIPVYSENRNNVVSLMFVKDLALLDPDDNFTVKMVCSYHSHLLRFVSKETPLRDMLEEFKKGDYHMAIVEEVVGESDDPENPIRQLLGVVTLEDILEEILQAEILDETDAILDNVHRTRRFRPIVCNSYTNDLINQNEKGRTQNR